MLSYAQTPPALAAARICWPEAPPCDPSTWPCSCLSSCCSPPAPAADLAAAHRAGGGGDL